MIDIEERIHTYAYQETLKSDEHAVYIGRIKETEKKISELPGGYVLLRELEESICLAQAIHLEKAYNIGFQDGKSVEGCPGCSKSA